MSSSLEQQLKFLMEQIQNVEEQRVCGSLFGQEVMLKRGRSGLHRDIKEPPAQSSVFAVAAVRRWRQVGSCTRRVTEDCLLIWLIVFMRAIWHPRYIYLLVVRAKAAVFGSLCVRLFTHTTHTHRHTEVASVTPLSYYVKGVFIKLFIHYKAYLYRPLDYRLTLYATHTCSHNCTRTHSHAHMPVLRVRYVLIHQSFPLL